MKKNNKGMTLLELTMVVFLLGVVLTMSTFFFAGFLGSSAFDATGRELSAEIRQARSLSRLKMQKQIFTIDLDARSYGLEGAQAKMIPPDIYISILDPSSREIHQGRYSIVFHDGSSAGGATFVLSYRKRVMRIEIDPITGAVLIRGKF